MIVDVKLFPKKKKKISGRLNISERPLRDKVSSSQCEISDASCVFHFFFKSKCYDHRLLPVHARHE